MHIVSRRCSSARCLLQRCSASCRFSFRYSSEISDLVPWIAHLGVRNAEPGSRISDLGSHPWSCRLKPGGTAHFALLPNRIASKTLRKQWTVLRASDGEGGTRRRSRGSGDAQRRPANVSRNPASMCGKGRARTMKRI